MPAAPPVSVAVIEPNLRLGERIARVVSASIGLEPVAVVTQATALPARVSAETRLVLCGSGDIDQVGKWFFNLYPQLRFGVWSAEPPVRVMEMAAAQPRLSSIIGWPRYASMPRPWELSLAARRAVFPDAPPPTLTELLRWGATRKSWRPQTSVDRDRVVSDVGAFAERAGADSKTASRIATMAHELLMNAMYDAPVDVYGRPRYAAERRVEVVLNEAERPLLQLATDGMLLALEVVDPFGGIERAQVFARIAQVLTASCPASDRGSAQAPAPVGEALLDTSHGGAGLGLASLYRDSAALVFDITRGQATRVMSVHELGVTNRELRAMPNSLHYFSS
ncbi:MAG: hypothetical protein Tsb0020_47660 [Haliangiales bacterium]